MDINGYFEDEEIDLVDHNDCIVGSIFRSKAYKMGIDKYRVVNAFIRNKNNQYYIPIRSNTKKIFPNALDFSVGGHVKKGETYTVAIKRECEEELNIKLDDSEIIEILYLNPEIDQVSSFMKVYIFEYNNEISYNKNDFQDAYWIFLDDLVEKIKNGTSAKDDIIKVINIIKRRNLTIASSG